MPDLPHKRSGDDWVLAFDEDRLWVSILGGASYSLTLPSHGRSVVEVHREAWSAVKAGLFFVLGVLPLALPRFGLTPLHGSSFSLHGSGAVIVMGDSGTGKSTILARQLELGATLLADDAVAVDDRGRLRPGPPYWTSRNDQLGDMPDYLGKAVCTADKRLEGPIRLGAAIVLSPKSGSGLAITPLSGKEAFLAVLSNQRSPWLFTNQREQARRLAATTAVARVPVAIAHYDQGRHTPEQLIQRINAWAEPLAGGSPTGMG
jgi:hypothetical protein